MTKDLSLDEALGLLPEGALRRECFGTYDEAPKYGCCDYIHAGNKICIKCKSITKRNETKTSQS